jgi:hypothetical protein
VIGRCLEEVLETEVERWLGRKRHVRRRKTQGQRVEVRCSRCFSHERQLFRRNGHYRRKLDTRWGRVRIDVPQVVCVCGGNVRLSFQTLRRGQRIWHDLEWDVLVNYERGLSYRQIKADWDQCLGSVGLRTLNQRVALIVTDCQPALGQKASPRSSVWMHLITVMFPTGKTCTDRMGRNANQTSQESTILAAQVSGPCAKKTSCWPGLERTAKTRPVGSSFWSSNETGSPPRKAWPCW